MALKQKQKTGWNGDKQHKYELNTNRDMAYSLKIRKMAIFEIQTRDIHTPKEALTNCNIQSRQTKSSIVLHHLWNPSTIQLVTTLLKGIFYMKLQ